ncbi:MAG: signal peptidase II [Streptococcaceae bacterium]|nr:signal peptidase II [Streptococcaceae bacterium]MCL2680989.1 signal peptidase II [Streptococcaceae bacterium]
MKKITAVAIIIIGIIADQAMKMWIVGNISLGQTRSFIPHVLSLTYLKNEGMAWSMLSGQQWLFLILTPIVVLVAVYYLLKKNNQKWYFIALSLIISGALGNFIDRVHQSYVVDMFQTEFMNFPIFNIADALLSIGFVALFIAILTDKEMKD